MKTPINRMINIMEAIIKEEVNRDKRLAYSYCVYLAKTYLSEEKDEIINAHKQGYCCCNHFPNLELVDAFADDYYKDTFTK